MSDSELPESGFTPLSRQANELHEIYLAYMDAGFPEYRAFELVTTILIDHLAS